MASLHFSGLAIASTAAAPMPSITGLRLAPAAFSRPFPVGSLNRRGSGVFVVNAATVIAPKVPILGFAVLVLNRLVTLTCVILSKIVWFMLMNLILRDLFSVLQYTSVKPLGDRVLIKIKTSEEVTVGGILLPSTAQSKPQSGEVVAVGEGRTVGDKKLAVGVQVVFSSQFCINIQVSKTCVIW